MFSEAPTGTIDGLNTTFALSYTPVAGTFTLARNGVIQQSGVDYAQSGTAVVYSVAPLVGDWHFCVYNVAGAGTTGVGSSWPVIQIGDIANWVANTKLKRPDLINEAIEEATKFYRTLCARVPFDSLMITSDEQSCTASIATYSLADLDPAIAGIVSIRMTYGTNQYMRLRRSHVRNFDMMSSVSTGRPYWYARFGGNLEFMPTPNLASYTYRIRYWTYPVILAEPQNTVCTYEPEWRELHEWETLHRMYMILDEHEKALMLMQPAMMPRQASPKRTSNFEIGIIPRLWNDLLKTINQREAIDEDFGLRPMRMP